MNIIKFVSVALWSMCMLFLSCKKENPSLNETPATVEIFVCNSKGTEMKVSGLFCCVCRITEKFFVESAAGGMLDRTIASAYIESVIDEKGRMGGV